jgi:hypothetical protein
MGKNRHGYILFVVLGVMLAAACKKPVQQPVTREEGEVQSCSNSGEFFPSGQAGLHGPVSSSEISRSNGNRISFDACMNRHCMHVPRLRTMPNIGFFGIGA